MTSNGASTGILTRSAFIAPLAVLVAAVLGYFVLSSSTTLRLTPATNSSVGPFSYSGPGGPLGSGEGSAPYQPSNGSGGGGFSPGTGEGDRGSASRAARQRVRAWSSAPQVRSSLTTT
jgi:hypothetical protein